MWRALRLGFRYKGVRHKGTPLKVLAKGTTKEVCLLECFCVERGPYIDQFGHRSSPSRWQEQPKKMGCFAAHVFGLVLAAGAASMPKAVDVRTSLDAKTIA